MRHAAAYEEEEATESGAELSLGMGTLIGIFFGLALVCGVFFGFGYLMGHRSPGPYVSSEPLYESPKPTTAPSAPKPSALFVEQPADSSRVVIPASAQPAVASIPSNVQQPAPQPTATVKTVPTPVESPKPTLAQNPAAPITPPSAQPAPVPVGAIMVQIAAVKNRTDAEALAEALRKNGFSPSIRTEPKDKLLHVQLGPFGNRDDAKAMRQRLSSAGYDAFIK